MRYFYVILLGFSTFTYSKDKGDEQFKGISIDGRVSVGAEIERLKHGNQVYDAKVRIKTKRKSGMKGILSLRTDNDREVFLQDAYINTEFKESGYELDFGKHKKRIGLEWQYGKKDRMSVSRTYIYKKLEEFTYVGRESVIKLSSPSVDEGNEFHFEAALGINEANDGNVNLFATKSFGPGNPNVGTWVLLQRDKAETFSQLVWANVLSLWSHDNPLRYEVELFSGVDPYESEFEKIFGDGKSIYFYAARTQLAYRFGFGTNKVLSPYLQLSYYVHDSEFPEYNTHEYITGLSYLIDQIQFNLTTSIVGTNSRIDSSTRTYDQSGLAGEVVVFF